MRKKVASNGTNGRLEEALANLINNQALFVGQLGRMDDRFARIEKQLAAIERLLVHQGNILADHQRILEALPEAIRQKIGFKGQG